MLKKCLYPVAGYGTRFLPATKSMAKEMLPVVDKPLIQYAVKEAMDAGLVLQSFVTGRTKRSIEDHFDISYELENEIRGSAKEKQLSEISPSTKSKYTITSFYDESNSGKYTWKGKPAISCTNASFSLSKDIS